jgi:hypothetical protein
MKTIFPSEPLLAEAAAKFMMDPKYKFNAPAALKTILGRFPINKGDHGELLVLLLLCLAHDAALTGGCKYTTVYHFMDKLFPDMLGKGKGSFYPTVLKHGMKPETFRSCFEESYIYFNHFIKVHEPDILNRSYLWRLFLRGAAVLCSNNQQGLDALIPFLYKSEEIAEWVISVMKIQITNNPNFGPISDSSLFYGMHPYRLHIFNKDDKALPIIRIVFALASPMAAFEQVQKDTSGELAEFTSFDFWCAGLSAKILGPIMTDEQGTWEALLQASRGWQDIYKADAPCAALRRAACPGSAADPDHWQHFTNDVPGTGTRKRKASDLNDLYSGTECAPGPGNTEDSDIVMMGEEQ